MTAQPKDLLIEFLETRDRDEDALGTAMGVASWMSERGLMVAGGQVTDADVTRVRHTRAALRSLFEVHSSDPVDARTRETLERVTMDAPLALHFGEDGSIELSPRGGGAAGALARLLALVYGAHLDGTLPRYKTCKKCGWAFYDESKNRSRVWCDMATCGSQTKAQSYRERKRVESGE